MSAFKEGFPGWWGRIKVTRGDYLCIVHVLVRGIRLDDDIALSWCWQAITGVFKDLGKGEGRHHQDGHIAWDALVTNTSDKRHAVLCWAAELIAKRPNGPGDLQLTWTARSSDNVSIAEVGLTEQERDRKNRKGTGGLKESSSPAPSLQNRTLPKRPPGQPSFEEQLKQSKERADKAEQRVSQLEQERDAAKLDAGIAASRATRLEQTVESEQKDKAALAAALNGKVTAEAAVHLVGAQILEDSKPNGGLGKVSTSLLADVGRYALPSLGLTQKDIEDLVEEAKKKAEEQAKKETKKEAEATCSNGWSESDTFLNHANHAEVRKRLATAGQFVGLDALQEPFSAYQAAVGGVTEAKGDGEAGRAELKGDRTTDSAAAATETRWSAKEKEVLKELLNSAAKAQGAALWSGASDYGYLNVAGGGSGSFQLRLRVEGAPEQCIGLRQQIPPFRLRALPVAKK